MNQVLERKADTLGKEELVDMYDKMVKIRRFDEEASRLFRMGRIPGFLHCYIGQEAVGVGVCANLRPDDLITSTHRGHGHLVAKGARLDRMMAEIYGKKTGYNKGKGGSMHIADVSLGILGANGIVGAGIPIATGVGIAIQLKGGDQVVVCFFGDGASNRGTFHEALNLASIWKLPVIYVVENNLYGVSMPQWKAQAIKDISIRADSYGMYGISVDGNDVLAVYNVTREAVNRARAKGGPSLIECKTYRWRGHYDGDPMTYRTEEEEKRWKKKDPIRRLKKRLIEMGRLTENDCKEIEKSVAKEIKEAVEFAEKSSYPEPKEALQDVFV